MSENKIETSHEVFRFYEEAFAHLKQGGYLPFLLVDEGSTVTAQAVGISMLSVAGSEAALLVVLGLPLIAIIAKTKIKDLL